MIWQPTGATGAATCYNHNFTPSRQKTVFIVDSQSQVGITSSTDPSKALLLQFKEGCQDVLQWVQMRGQPQESEEPQTQTQKTVLAFESKKIPELVKQGYDLCITGAPCSCSGSLFPSGVSRKPKVHTNFAGSTSRSEFTVHGTQ